MPGEVKSLVIMTGLGSCRAGIGTHIGDLILAVTDRTRDTESEKRGRKKAVLLLVTP